MNRKVLLGCLLSVISCLCGAQNVFNPLDPIVRFDGNQPYGTVQHPDTNVAGLQKWVSTPTIGVTLGTDTFDVSSFKQYFINFNGAKMAFRLKFPNSYHKPDSAEKKYPINLFLHGGGEVGCPTNGGVYNNEKPLWLGGKLFRERVDKNEFDGFLLYPQLVVYEGCFASWGTAASKNYQAIIAIIDSMAKYIRADIDRVVVDGLSGGGYGAWRMADGYPQRVAKIMPSAAAGSVSNRNAFVHIPIWFATGGLDPDPSPTQAQYSYTKMKEIGADIRYTMFPDRGHAVWYQHWREPDFVKEMNEVHKANPLVFFQHDEFCLPENVDAKLGITPGFAAYEWQKDGVTIAVSANNVNTILDDTHIISFTGNEITVRSYGTYRVRFQRSVASEWSAWSPKPAVIGPKGETVTDSIRVNGARSKVLPAPDGSTTVPLILPEGFISYEWYDVSSDALVSTSRNFTAPVGIYKARTYEEFGCTTEFSPEFKVVDANGSPKPDPATTLSAVPLSQTAARLNWTQGAGETGFEIYRSQASGGPYTFIVLTNANTTSFQDTGLARNVMYYYIVRAVSETGAASASNEAPVKTLIDNAAPTAPSNLQYTQGSGPTSVQLTWTASTDNGALERYDIYVNGTKLYSTTSTSYTINHLDSLTPYNFTVRAIDDAGNVSPSSNQVTYVPTGATRPPIPGRPAGVSATALSYNVIEVQWQDTSANETGFEVVRSTSLNGTYIPVATTAPNATSFRDSGLTASKKYFYRVRAIGQGGESPFSDKVEATTHGAPATPVAPSQLSAQAAANNNVSLSWLDNSANETGFVVYRSTDNETFTLIATLPTNSNAYTDTDVSNLTTYYYYVAGINGAGTGAQSNTASILAGNNAPQFASLDDIFAKWGSTVHEDFTVTDDPGNTLTVTMPGKPVFVAIAHTGGSGYRITVTAGAEHVGFYELPVVAADNFGRSDTVIVTINISDKNSRSVYLNFGSAGKSAGQPWNNWLGTPEAGSSSGILKDESNIATGLSITAVNGWSGTTDIGHITGNNSGVFPDAVLRSGLGSTETREFRISGLNSAKRYNIVLAGSQNEGIPASTSFMSGSASAVLQTRYNTNQTANLNGLVPDANGEILFSVSRADTSPVVYLNGLVLEEYDAGVLLAPNNIYAESQSRTSVRITWSDRSGTENTSDGYQLVRATDSLFSEGVTTINLPSNSNVYTNMGLSPNTKYWFRVRSKTGSAYSEYSRAVPVITPAAIVYVNFNTTVTNAPQPWNNLATPPLSNFTTPTLKNQSGGSTTMALTLEQEFNGEFTAGATTGNNSGVVPDFALAANYWLDKNQLGRFRLSGLNHTKRYRIGFFGSSSTPDWFKGNYTATYTVSNRTVYLNSWMNTSKVVYIPDLSPDADGKLLLNFSTTPEAGYGFNGGIIIEEYDDSPPEDTTTTPPPVDTIPDNPPPVDTIPDNPPPVDTIPDNPPPIDTIPDNPPPVDTIPDNPPPVDTIPDNPPPVDTIPDNPPPVDTIPNGPPPVDSLDEDDPYSRVTVYPNPFRNIFNVDFYNRSANNDINVEIYDPYGRLTFLKNYGKRPVGSTVLVINSFEANMRGGAYFLALKLNGRIYRTMKLVKNKN